MICFNCDKVGHQGEHRPNSKQTRDQLGKDFPIHHQSNLGEDTTKQISPDQDFGSWMMVKKTPPRKSPLRTEKHQ